MYPSTAGERLQTINETLDHPKVTQQLLTDFYQGNAIGRTSSTFSLVSPGGNQHSLRLEL